MDGFEVYLRGGIDRSWDGLDVSGKALNGRKESKMTPQLLSGTFINSINIYSISPLSMVSLPEISVTVRKY